MVYFIIVDDKFVFYIDYFIPELLINYYDISNPMHSNQGTESNYKLAVF